VLIWLRIGTGTKLSLEIIFNGEKHSITTNNSNGRSVECQPTSRVQKTLELVEWKQEVRASE